MAAENTLLREKLVKLYGRDGRVPCGKCGASIWPGVAYEGATTFDRDANGRITAVNLPLKLPTCESCAKRKK